MTFNMACKFLVIFTLIVQLTSCHKQLVPNKVFVSNIEKIACKQPDSIAEFYTYYQGEKIDFEYTPIALISVIKGNQKDSIDLKSTLKYNATLSCADAVINLNQSYDQGTYKHTKYMYSDNSAYHIQDKAFDMLSYHGLAVKLKSKIGLRKDENFVREFSKISKEFIDYQTKIKYQKSSAEATIAGFIALVVVTVAFLLTVKPF
jgi:hypothetical protein